MNAEKLKEVLGQCYEECMIEPQTFPTDEVYDWDSDESASLEHAAWMALEAQKFVDAGELEKAQRWLGFIQGVLWVNGMMTINEMRDMNRGATQPDVQET